jgi:uroporphyrinogen decarboxylase
MSINSKERIRMLLSGRIPDRMGKADAPWPEARARWYKEGVPAGVHVNDLLGMDMRVNIKMPPSFRLEEKVVEETGEFQVISDADGNVSKYWKNKSGVPMHLSYAVQNRADWERLKDRLAPSDDRFAVGYYGNYWHEYTHGDFAKVKAAYDAFKVKDETFVSVEMPDPYEYAMAKMGDENILMTMAMEPELLKDMFEGLVKYVIGQGEILFSRGFKPDGVFVGGDIAYKNGLLMSPKMYRELIFPYLKRMIDHFKGERGLRIVYHSDGNPTEALPMLYEAGIDCIQPLEVNAGMDVRKLAKEWGDKLAFMGNISTQVMAGPKDKLREEVMSRIEYCKKVRARYIIHSDHSVPDTVPFENMRLVVELVDTYGYY